MTLEVQNWPIIDSNYYNNLFYCQPEVIQQRMKLSNDMKELIYIYWHRSHISSLQWVQKQNINYKWARYQNIKY